MADYIGARYVIKVYENSLDPSSAEWESGFAYEPLTLVTYNNSSYLSKVDVPASVGSPDANPTYWTITGAYNGQILQLQNDISDINNAIDGRYAYKTTQTFIGEHDGVKTVGDLISDVATQLSDYIDANPGIHYEFNYISPEGVSCAPLFKTMRTSYADFTFSRAYISSVSTYQNATIRCNKVNPHFFFDENGTITDRVSEIATQDVRLQISLYDRL